MSVRLTVLSDNLTASGACLAEHGWSVWVETPAGRYLFDTGAGHVLLHNAAALGVDLGTAEAVLLSHFHYDHTGGLFAALERTGDVDVHAHPDLFRAGYAARSDGPPQFTGIPHSRVALESRGARFRLTDAWARIDEHLSLTGAVPRLTSFEHVPRRFVLQGPDGLIHDTLPDDQSAVVQTDRGVLLLLGCCHAGLVNTMNHVAERTGCTEIHTVIGGTHMAGVSDTQLAETVKALRRYKVRRFAPSHCTGLGTTVKLAAALPDAFVPCGVGIVFTDRA